MGMPPPSLVTSNFPDVAMDSFGNILIAWEQNDGGQSNRYVRHFSLDGQALSPPVKVNLLASVDGKMGLMDIAMNDTGEVVIAWSGASYLGWSTVACRMTTLGAIDNGLIQAPEVLLPPAPFFHYYYRPVVDINRFGDVLLAWSEKKILSDGSVKYHTAWATRYSPLSGLWSGPYQVGTPKRAEKVSGIITTGGHVVLVWNSPMYVWMEVLGPDMVPIANRKAVGGSSGPGSHRAAVSMQRHGANKRLVISWENLNTSSDYIYASFYSIN
jgi:hypothetical protein